VYMFGVYNSPKPKAIYREKLIIEDAFELVNGGILFFSKDDHQGMDTDFFIVVNK